MSDVTSIPEQLSLIPSTEIDDGVFTEMEQRGVFTGERLKVRDPQRYQVVASLLAEGLGVKTVAALAKVSVHTVQAVRDHEPHLIATLKEDIAKTARSTARLCVDRLRDAVLNPDSKISARDLAIITGVLVDKAELLSGGPTARLEIGEAGGHGELQAFMEELRRRAQETDLGGDSGGTKEAIDVTDQVDPGDEPGAPADRASRPRSLPAVSVRNRETGQQHEGTARAGATGRSPGDPDEDLGAGDGHPSGLPDSERAFSKEG